MHLVTAIDIQTHHDIDHIVNRSYDAKDNLWILMAFSNDCIVETINGLEPAHPGNCFLKSPEFIEHHFTPKTSKVGFINDWLYICSESVGALVSQLSLPVNQVIHTNQPELLRSLLQKIIIEKRNLLPFNEYYISNIVEQLFIRLARANAEANGKFKSKYNTELVNLRIKLANSLGHNWSITQMAKDLGLSNSRFSILYKDRFGLSPNDDLIRMRLDKAKTILLSTDYKLQHVAQICGFKNEFYFSKIFKEKENMSPGSFRKED